MTSSSAAQDEFDQFIAKNTAGAPSRHPEDSRTSSDGSDAASVRSDDDDDREKGANTRSTGGIRAAKARSTSLDSEDEDDDAPSAGDNMKAARYFLPSRQSAANTGPKGVIADAYAFEHAKKNKRSSVFSVSSSSKKPGNAAAPRRGNDGEKRGSDEDDDEDEDDDFIREWRQSRLQELRSQEGKRRVSPPTGRRWGTLQTVDGEGYLDAVERSGRDTTVLVLIYDDASDVSNMVEQLVRQLARAHASTRFVRLHYEEAEMEGAGVPALLAYRNGDKFAGLVPLVDELPDDAELNTEALQKLLQRHQMLL